MAVTKAEQDKRLKRNEEKWSSTLMEAGYTVLPSIILEKQHALGLDPIDVNILMQLARHWWYSDTVPSQPFDKTPHRPHFIQREARYTKRKFGGQDTNKYSFEGLIKAATPYAKEAIALREKQNSENVGRRNRKKPAPTLVVDNTFAKV